MTWLTVTTSLLALLLAVAALREARRARRRLDDLPAPLPPVPPPLPAKPLEDEALRRALGTEEEARGALARRVAALERSIQDQEAQTALLEERLGEQKAAAAALVASASTPDAEADGGPEAESAAAESEARAALPSPTELARRALQAQGYARVALLPRPDDPLSFIVEAERNGMIAKGRATVDDVDGRVTFTLKPALRAFP